MPDFTWMQMEDRLSPAALTVRAQAISPNDQGRRRWDLFFPRANVDSVDLRDMTTLDFRPAADRREWNARGRHIPLLTPAMREMSIVPIESYFKIEEKEMQRLAERTLGNDALIRQQVRASIPDRTDLLVEANYNRLEIDSMQAWVLGTITQRNPENAAQTVTVSFQFSGSRYTAAGTAWNDPGINGYDAFLAWYAAAIELAGPGEGVVLRQATLNAILADAPNLPNSVKMTRAQIEARIQDDVNGPFRFVVIEDSLDVFDDGGTAYTRTKVWPAQRVAFIPANGVVGRTAFAPVVRAMELSNRVPGAGIDIRGVTVYHDAANAGRELTVEAQLNAMPIPDESRVVVINAGV